MGRKQVTDFHRLWSATTTANLGDALYLVGLPLLALAWPASPGQVAGVTVVLTAAWPVAGLPAGLLADRLDRRRLVLLVNIGRSIVLGGLTALVAAHRVTIVHIYAAAFLIGVAETLVDSSLAALVPATVAAAHLGRANARVELTQNVASQFVGPPLAGLLAAAGLAWVTGVGGLLYLAAIPLLWSMHGSYRAAGPARRGLTEGLRFLMRRRLLRTITLLTAAMNLFWSAWTAVLVVYAVRPGPVGLTPAGYGLLLVSLAIGGVVGAALVEPMRRRFGDRLTLAIDVVGTILLIGTPAMTSNAFIIGAAMVVGGAGSAVWRVIAAVLRARLTPPHLLGRVYSASRVVSWGALPVGAALGGLVAQTLGVRAVFAIGGLASLGLVAVFLLTVRPGELQSLQPIPQAPQQRDRVGAEVVAGGAAGDPHQPRGDQVGDEDAGDADRQPAPGRDLGQGDRALEA